jgi:hypothetical protein
MKPTSTNPSRLGMIRVKSRSGCANCGRVRLCLPPLSKSCSARCYYCLARSSPTLLVPKFKWTVLEGFNPMCRFNAIWIDCYTGRLPPANKAVQNSSVEFQAILFSKRPMGRSTHSDSSGRGARSSKAVLGFSSSRTYLDALQ